MKNLASWDIVYFANISTVTWVIFKVTGDTGRWYLNKNSPQLEYTVCRLARDWYSVRNSSWFRVCLSCLVFMPSRDMIQLRGWVSGLVSSCGSVVVYSRSKLTPFSWWHSCSPVGMNLYVYKQLNTYRFTNYQPFSWRYIWVTHLRI